MDIIPLLLFWIRRVSEEFKYFGEGVIGEVYEIKEEYEKALYHYTKMVEYLPKETVNKGDFMEDVLRMKNKLNERQSK